MPALAFEIEHRIDHVLEHARSGDQAFFRNVPDQHDDHAAALREPDQFLRRTPYLADGARRAVERVEIHGLDRIDDRQVGRPAVVERADDVAHAAGRGQPYRPLGDAEPLSPQPHLVDCFFASHVSHVGAARSQRGGGLQQ